MSKPEPPSSDSQHLVPGLAIAGLLFTGVASLLYAFLHRDVTGLFAAALSFAGLGWVVSR
jgi:hypothetical protein